MVKTIEEYETDIRKTLKRLAMYSTALEVQITSLASAQRNLAMANRDIDDLSETTVEEKTRYGHKLAPHPVFKIAKDAQDLVTRQMKALGLTAELLSADTDSDPMADLTRKVIKASRKPVIIKPDPKTDGKQRSKE